VREAGEVAARERLERRGGLGRIVAQLVGGERKQAGGDRQERSPDPGHVRGIGTQPPGVERVRIWNDGPMDRADRVSRRIEERELDLLLVTDLTNVRYLTGFTGTNGLAIVGPGTRRFLTDFRYIERARGEVRGFDVEAGGPDLAATLGDGWPAGALRLGFEDHQLTVRRHARVRETLPERIEFVAAGGLVEAERAVKEPAELDSIRAAAALADDVYGWLADWGLVGRSEREVALALEHEMRVRGADGPSFPSIVAAAENGALPHATPRDVPIPPRTLVTLDIGVRLDGYCSDCTRTWATGEVDDDLAEIYELVRRTQAAALAAVRAGPTGREVDAVARELIAAAGHEEHFGHGLGHGVGLEVHEAPRLTRSEESQLAPGNVVTVEPGVYVPGRGGVRIEDLVVVTEDGCEVLSGTATALTVVA
jgi:Xaa-Pro aminopeptidase